MGILIKEGHSMSKKIFYSIILLILVALYAGSTYTTAASSISLNETNLTLTRKETVKLKLKGTKKKCKWSVNKPKIISVSKSGKIKALKAGKAKVTAMLGKKKYTCYVKVIAKTKDVEAETQEDNTINTLNNNAADNDAVTGVITGFYIEMIASNGWDTYILTNTNEQSGISYSIGYGYITDDVIVTLNNEVVDKSLLAKGDALEIGYVGELPQTKFAWVPHIAYIKASRSS